MHTIPIIPSARVFLLCVIACSVHAQSFQLEHIGIEQGLSQGFISAICQDSEDFLWFGTNNGLNRYDGQEFLIFKHDPYDPYSISGDKIIDVKEAGDLLCVLTQELDLYDRQTRRFHRLPKSFELFRLDHCKIIAQGRNTLWALSNINDHYRLYRISWPEDLAVRLRRGEAAEPLVRFESLPQSFELRNMLLSVDGRSLWLAGDHDMYALDPASGMITRQIDSPIPDASGAKLFADADGGIWASAPGFLAHFGGTGWQIFPLPSNASMPYFDPSSASMWLNFATGMARFNTHRLPPVLLMETAEQTFAVADNAFSGYTDSYGNTWFSTNAHGILKFNPRTGIFKNYLSGHSIYGPLYTNREAKVWWDARGNDYNLVLNAATGRLQHSPFPDLSELYQGYRFTMDERGDYWIFCNDSRNNHMLLHFRPAEGEMERIPLPDICFNQSPMLRYVAPGQVWIVNTRQMVRFEIATGKFTVFRIGFWADDCISQVYALERTPEGIWWIGLQEGLVKAESVSGKDEFKFSLLQNNAADRNSLSANYIKSLLIDPADSHVLWIGTGGRGLDRLDTRTNAFRHYNTQNGLPDDVVYGVVAEDALPGQTAGLWLSTNKGLTRLDPGTGAMRYFFKSDGLQDNEFNTFAYGKMESGKIMFGGVNGLTIFDPRESSVNARQPRVFITGLKINNKTTDIRDSATVLTQSIENTREIELPFRQNNLALQFVALDLTQPARNRFRFYLEGAEPAWSHEGFEHGAQYLNLAPGTYVFKVAGSNSDGVWNETPTTLRIVIRPPWWASWWAYLAYIFLAAGAVYGVFLFQLKRKWQKAETQRLKELDTVKTRLYTNITHEFRTPLTVILGMAEQVQEYLGRRTGEAPLRAVEMIRRNGQNLLTLINQMLDLAKLESGHLPLETEHGDVVSFLRYLTESFHSFAAGKQIQLHFLSDLPTLEMDFDKNKLQAIIGNLLSNAIKFTPENGHIYLQISRDMQKGAARLVCKVRDTGVGIAPEQLPRLFDRFYQADNSSTRRGEGTGIGLSLVQELVKLMGGEIRAESEPGRGTTFVVSIPLVQPEPGAVRTEHKKAFDYPAVLSSAPVVADSLSATASAHQPRLLLVEDNPDVAEYVRTCVASSFTVDIATNGRLGIERALESIPDIIISDVMMPEKDGYELCDTLKNDERSSHIPIVLLTAKAATDDRIAGLRRGADAYLTKPFHREELSALLDGLLENRARVQAQYRRMLLRDGQADTGIPEHRETALENAFLQKIRAFAEAELGNPALSLDDLCRATGMGRSNLYEKFTALAGMPPMQYVRSMRLRKAKELLAEGSMNVSETAFAVGFDDPRYFTRMFSEEFGMPPTQWRKMK